MKMSEKELVIFIEGSKDGVDKVKRCIQAFNPDSLCTTRDTFYDMKYSEVSNSGVFIVSNRAFDDDSLSISTDQIEQMCKWFGCIFLSCIVQRY